MTATPNGRIQDKVALITGAASGIGRATAERFAAEGARLALTDLNTDALDELVSQFEKSGVPVISVPADITSEADIQRVVHETMKHFGRIDILVANAGVIPEADLATATADLWDHTMAVDARGMFLSCKYAAAEMVHAGRGAIVCLSSISAFAGQKGQAVYGPAKFVASGITKHLAIDLADKGVRVNAVAPGTIDTPAVAKMDADAIRKVVAMHPMGRMGKPAEIASAILFLASDDASFITGAVLPVDGGYLAQ
ncbi:SDR family NAD(P)-dependent oxidoreductase [Komagataeibacter swingsii]|uniref:SDR family oxidoreductase n=1 Tax=Komagataeibacter swingsii TaxID=215220 RepID=A0A850NU42_9PROT|nr:SDR family NAD(P)-dependent oxidoreductase [Komagataeibacter swingsii]NVN35787.1 SDR family oxidoreductase [Komagataeibacter swingsii]